MERMCSMEVGAWWNLLIKFILKKFCQNLEGSFPDRSPSKFKIKYEKRESSKLGPNLLKVVQLLHGARMQHSISICYRN